MSITIINEEEVVREDGSLVLRRTYSNNVVTDTMLEPSQDYLDSVEADQNQKLAEKQLLEQQQQAQEKTEAAARASIIAARAAISPLIRSESLADKDLVGLEALFDDWMEGVAYEVGDLVNYLNEIYECIQAHTSQSDWLPSDTASLWKVHRPAGSVTAWQQPSGAHDAYGLGEKVTHNNDTWESIVKDNVWEPGVYGWKKL